MKHLLITLLTLLTLSCYAESKITYNAATKTYSTTTATSKDNYTNTGCFYNIKGTNYPIYISKSGSCFIIRTSKKTGKEYKMYLPKDLQEAIRKQLNFKK